MCLPDPNEEKSSETADLVAAMNKAVSDDIISTQQSDSHVKVDKLNRKRPRSYSYYDDETRAKIARYAVENGCSRSAVHFSRVLGKKLNESTVRGMRSAYLKVKHKSNVDVISSLPRNHRGHGPLLGQHEGDLVHYINAIRLKGGIVNRKILIAAGKGLLLRKCRSSLQEFGGHVNLTRGWAQSFLNRHGYVKRKGTKAARKLPENFIELKSGYLQRIADIVKEHAVPEDLIVNFDQTGVNIVPTSNWTLEKEGSKQVPIVGLDDKRQMTAVLACAANGVLLPPQLLYKGKTVLCHPVFKFPGDWDIWHSENHWSNEATMCRYIDNVIRPYLESTRRRLSLPEDHPAIVILDVFRAHRCDSVLDKLRDIGARAVFVPASCTGELQPMDLSVNARFKQYMTEGFTDWYANEICGEDENNPVDLKLSRLKPLHANWLVKAIDRLQQDRELLRTGFEQAGITSAIA